MSKNKNGTAKTKLWEAYQAKQLELQVLKSQIMQICGVTSHQSFYDILNGSKSLSKEQQEEIAKLFDKNVRQLFPFNGRKVVG